MIAIYALFSGIVRIVHAFGLRNMFQQWWVLLLSGVVNTAFGIAALYYYPALSLAFAVVWAAWWLFLTGGIEIYAAMVERRLGVSWGWSMAFGILSIVAGVFAFMSPPATLAAIIALIAGFAILSGIMLLTGAFRLSSAKQEVTNAMRSARA